METKKPQVVNLRLGLVKMVSRPPTAQVAHAGIKPAEPPTVKSKAVALHVSDNNNLNRRVNFLVSLSVSSLTHAIHSENQGLTANCSVLRLAAKRLFRVGISTWRQGGVGNPAHRQNKRENR
jgi:hypothetical protein